MVESPMNIEEVAKYLGLHEKTVRDMAAVGRLPGHKIGDKGNWFFFQSEVDRALRAGKSVPEPAPEADDA